MSNRNNNESAAEVLPMIPPGGTALGLPHIEIIDSIEIPDVDPERMVVPGASGNELKATVQFRTLPVIVRNVEVLLDSRKLPYQTKSDIHRAAHYIGLRALLQAGNLGSAVGSMEMMIQSLIDDEVQAKYMDLVQRMNTVVTRHIDGSPQGYVHVGRIVMKVRAMAETGMPEGYWRKKVLAAIDQNFGGVLGLAMQYMGPEDFNAALGSNDLNHNKQGGNP